MHFWEKPRKMGGENAGTSFKFVKNHIKFVTIIRRRKLFSENLLAIEIKNAEAVMNKPVYLGLSILDISKIVILEFMI